MILEFLKELKYSYKDNEKIYTEGSCFRLYKILKTVFPQANPYYSDKEGHWITEIDGSFYDINGELHKDFVQSMKFKIVTDNITLQSAYVPTYEGQNSWYTKYKQSI